MNNIINSLNPLEMTEISWHKICRTVALLLWISILVVCVKRLKFSIASNLRKGPLQTYLNISIKVRASLLHYSKTKGKENRGPITNLQRLWTLWPTKPPWFEYLVIYYLRKGEYFGGRIKLAIFVFQTKITRL